MSEIGKIVALLGDEALEKQIAAAIVLGELRAKGPEVTEALAKKLDSGIGLLQHHALEALARVGAKKALPRIFPLLAAREEDVRKSAARAIASIGEEVVPLIRERMATATPDEHRALDNVLAMLGGKDAFTALLAGLAGSDGEAAKAAAIAMRQRIKEADGNRRRSYLAETEKFLEKQTKSKDKKSEAAMAAALKILGYLEDEKAMATLLAYAKDAKAPASVRQEALIALRFTLADKKDAPKVVDVLLECAGSPDRTLAHTALHTLGSLNLPSSAGVTKHLEQLVGHPDLERARFVIDMLGRQGGADAAKVLVKLLGSVDRRRAELAATALTGKEEAVPLLAKALLETEDADRGWMIRNVLRPSAKKMTTATRKQLLEQAMEKMGDSKRGWEAMLDVVRDADPDAVATSLRDLGLKLRKKGDEKASTVLGLLCRSDRATDDDRYMLASLELAKSSKDTRAGARATDEALRQLSTLLTRGYDLAGALKKDRAVGPEEMYYLGFHFVEGRHPLGRELLSEVVKKAGRAKVGKMAKNKLALAPQADG
jgi:HEAT repeat protein